MCAQQRLRSAWSSDQFDQSSLCPHWVVKDPRFLQANSEDSDQTGQMPRLIGVFTECTGHFLVLSCWGSVILTDKNTFLFLSCILFPSFFCVLQYNTFFQVNDAVFVAKLMFHMGLPWPVNCRDFSYH